MITLDLRKDSKFHYGGTSGGMLIKWEKNGYHIKTGRHDIRNYLGKSGIEPIIEVIVYELGKKLRIPVAHEELGVIKYLHHDKEHTSIANFSKDFKKNRELFELEDLVLDELIKGYSFTDIREFDSSLSAYMLAYLDFITLNEDRHSRNIAWLSDDKSMRMSPIYDNGYSLLYDDIRGLFTDFRKSAKGCPCNSPTYGHSFSNIEALIVKRNAYLRLYGEKEIFNAGIRSKTILGVVTKVRSEYLSITSKYKVDNIELSDTWFKKVYELLCCRCEYARSL